MIVEMGVTKMVVVSARLMAAALVDVAASMQAAKKSEKRILVDVVVDVVGCGVDG